MPSDEAPFRLADRLLRRPKYNTQDISRRLNIELLGRAEFRKHLRGRWRCQCRGPDEKIRKGGARHPAATVRNSVGSRRADLAQRL